MAKKSKKRCDELPILHPHAAGGFWEVAAPSGSKSQVGFRALFAL
jgi:hypothetical protein